MTLRGATFDRHCALPPALGGPSRMKGMPLGRHCERRHRRGEAIHQQALRSRVDCFVALLPAMTLMDGQVFLQSRLADAKRYDRRDVLEGSAFYPCGEAGKHG
jgi:hypothetical protein